MSAIVGNDPLAPRKVSDEKIPLPIELNSCGLERGTKGAWTASLTICFRIRSRAQSATLTKKACGSVDLPLSLTRRCDHGGPIPMREGGAHEYEIRRNCGSYWSCP